MPEWGRYSNVNESLTKLFLRVTIPVLLLIQKHLSFHCMVICYSILCRPYYFVSVWNVFFFFLFLMVMSKD